MADENVKSTEVEKNENECTGNGNAGNKETVNESKPEKDVPQEEEEKMDCDEGPSVENNNNDPPKDENAVTTPASDSVNKAKERDQANTYSNDNENKDNKNPETYVLFQNNKEQTDKSTKLEQSKVSKQNNSSVAVNGNEESMCSVDEFSRPSSEIQNCYCGQERNLGAVELQCGGCSKWFHEQCINISIGKSVPFMTYYTFYCKHCNPNGVETFSKKQSSFSQMCATAIANLMQQSASEGNHRNMFSKDKEIIPYIVANWESLTTMQRRIKQTWHNTVYKAMVKDSDVFSCEEKPYDTSADSLYPMFGLVNQDLSKMCPPYDSQGRGSQKLNIDSSSSQGGSAFSGSKGRQKRKFFDSQMSGARKVKSDLVMPKLPPNGYPLEHPFNKDGYRYILAEPDPHAPFRQEFDESQDWAGKPIPGWLYRKLTPSNVLIALHDRDETNEEIKVSFLHPHGPSPSFKYPDKPDILTLPHSDILTVVDPLTTTGRVYSLTEKGKYVCMSKIKLMEEMSQMYAPQLKVSEDRLSVTGEKGYCMARATHGVNRGTWYFEITIEDMPDGAATRLGWSQPLGNLQGPLGYDKFSYSWRSRKGSKFHESRGSHYSDEGYGQGDVLGFLIHLPDNHSIIPLPPIYKDKPLVKFKSYLYYEEKDELQLELKNMKPLKGSKMVFYKNGKCMGTAFQDINAGTYYPAISLYKSVTVSLNFGPNFKYPPQGKYKPVHDLAHETAIEQAMTELLFLTSVYLSYELYDSTAICQQNEKDVSE